MLHLNCAKCHTVLTIDDAFAGGVCRCNHCGAIQTVPKHPTHTRPTPSNPDLTDLPQSSTIPTPTAHSPRPTRTLLLTSTLIALLAIAATATILWRLRPHNPPIENQNSKIENPTPHPLTPSSPHFLTLPLSGPTIIYLLDRGSASLDTFDLLRDAALNSLSTLGPDRKFQIIFWQTDSLIAFPEKAPDFATPTNISAARQAIADVYAHGQSQIAPALEKALASNPSEIIIATAKPGLDDDFLKTVANLRNNRPTKIHTIALGPTASTDTLQSTAQKCSGLFRPLSKQHLRPYAE